MKVEDAIKEVIACVVCETALDCHSFCPFYREGDRCAERTVDEKEAILFLRKTFNI